MKKKKLLSCVLLFFVSISFLLSSEVQAESLDSKANFIINKKNDSSNEVILPGIPENGQAINYLPSNTSKLPQTGSKVENTFLLLGCLVLSILGFIICVSSLNK
ncbi:LPXTG cell wall anchor domain-containing protein, partial [Enterococcus faecalis]|nr:LPXTG cell wall anchor domain-containing protein [Enterococcus faecalis]